MRNLKQLKWSVPLRRAWPELRILVPVIIVQGIKGIKKNLTKEKSKFLFKCFFLTKNIILLFLARL